MKSLLERKDADFDRPYERCLLYGPQALTDAQLLAVIMRCGTKGVPAMHLAEQVLSLVPGKRGLKGLARLRLKELTSLPGIGEVKAIQLLCIGELSKRIATLEARERLSFSSAASVADYFMERLRNEETEHLYCLMFDTKLRLIGEEKLSDGTVSFAVIGIRELFSAAMRSGAVNIILVHNHPSGDPVPSGADIELTHRVFEAGAILEIRLLDHVVVGDGAFYSFLENNLLIPGGVDEDS